MKVGVAEPTPGTRQVAALLADIGLLLELNGQDSFRARAFTSAARALEGLDVDLGALARDDRLTTLRGIGAGIAPVIREYVLTGRSSVRDELQAATPIGLYDLLRVPGLGPKRIHTLHQRLGIDSLDALERAASAGEVGSLPGFGAKTEKKILSGIAFARSSRQLRRYPDALEVAGRLVEWLRGLPEVERAEIAGQLRRRMETVDRIDLVAATADPAAVLAHFGTLADGGAESGDGAADTGVVPADATTGVALDPEEAELVLSDGISVRLRCASPAGFGLALVWQTGNAAHLEALSERAAHLGCSFDSRGLGRDGGIVEASSEAELYEALGLAFVHPELREGLGEVERAAEGRLPTLVELKDLRGTFHCHTTYSDGKATLLEMAEAARDHGWAYLGIADHSRAAAYARGLSIESVRAQHAEIDRLNQDFSRGESPFRLFKGIESDILPDGSLDYPADVLAEFDYVVGSIHSSFGMPREEMTARVVRAVTDPALTILGHPTGRLLLTRAGYAVDVEAILEAAARHGVVIEINANPHRLDLDWRHVRNAAELGILIAVNPDAHSVAALDHVAFGIGMARKAGLEPRQILNTWTVEEVSEYFAKRKP
jgi:DNA polymerase (family X)